MRLYVPIRVSRDDVASASSESQRDGALEYRDTHPGTTITFAEIEDLSVSGKTPIVTRLGIAPILTPAKINTWDAIGVFEIDRLSRNMEDYLGFVRLMDGYGKIIVDLVDGTDTSTPEGRRTLEDRVLAAQRYRQVSGEKRARRAQRLSNAGQWGGGRKPFGYAAEAREIMVDNKTKRGYFLVQDRAGGEAHTARRMAEDALNGKSILAITEDLKARNVPTTIKRGWHDTAVRRILTSPALMGYVVKMVKADPASNHNNIVTLRRDRDGQPIKFTDDPILTPDDWRKLQDVLTGRARKRGTPQARRLLWDVGFCRNCSQPCEDELPCPVHDVNLYGYERQQGRVSRGSYYHCRQCGLHVRKSRFEAYIDYLVRNEAGRRPLVEWASEPVGEFSSEIIKLEKRVERWKLDQDVEYDEGLAQAISNAEARITKLIEGARKPEAEPKLILVEPRITIGEHWASLDTQGRNKYLRDTQAVFYADKTGVVGQLGWMATDSSDFNEIRRALRKMKLPTMRTWQEIDELLAREISA